MASLSVGGPAGQDTPISCLDGPLIDGQFTENRRDVRRFAG
jgi:hypothetical protein